MLYFAAQEIKCWPWATFWYLLQSDYFFNHLEKIIITIGVAIIHLVLVNNVISIRISHDFSYLPVLQRVAKFWTQHIFCFYPACLPARQKQHAKEFYWYLLTIIFNVYIWNRQNRDKENILFLCKVIWLAIGTIVWWQQQHHGHSQHTMVWTHHAMVLDSPCNGFGLSL